MDKITSFTQLFTELELGDNYEQIGYILDAPDTTFNVIKDDFKDSIIQSLSQSNLNSDLIAVSGQDIDIKDLKEEIATTTEIFSQLFEEIDHDLPQDRIDFFLSLIQGIKEQVIALPERKVIDVVIEKIKDNAIIPTYAHPTDAGADCYATETITINGFETTVVGLGIKVAIPEGYEIQIRPRSGMSMKTPIRVANAPGTIDCGYRDEIGIICQNTSMQPYTINEGDRIAQMIIAPSPMINFTEGKVDNIGNNRNGGFGSSGK
jgi:dUTP pyrophosphatase